MSEERLEKHARRIKNVEEAILLLTEKVLQVDDRLDKQQNHINRHNEFNRDFEVKMNALIDAQIRSEDETERSNREFQRNIEEMRRVLADGLIQLKGAVTNAHSRLDSIESKS